ncbi:PREDICTED: putative nuclease HARBI1 isoform X1 [Rhagoletis zephyria]|uniref:putative nuclease HARBI1 isoform X1 n=2 Tax=Rhagoletis TaxID=28609 RepID=UPI0008116D4B|nr:PREDICTED: putative nuclease HARBI1 isoform X1 [Rhagoletis zephyria]
MEEEIIAFYFILKKRENEARNVRRRILASLRDTEDPFLLQEEIFSRFLRFPKSLCWDLIQELKPHDNYTRKSRIPLELRFISVLYFLSNGSYQSCIGNSHFAAMSQPSVSRNIKQICRMVVEHKHVEISFPNSADHYNSIKRGFHNKFAIKGVIGAIDCTHVAIISPPSSTAGVVPHEYMNRKGYCSINVEAICDEELIFRNVNARFPGSCHDAGIWTTSPVRIKLIREHVSGAFKWLLGDSGYPLEPWLLTPIPSPSSANEELFNTVHIKARNTIERAFGVLKSRFRCLSKERVLKYTHTNAAFIIYTCAIFHNILQKRRIFLSEETMLPEDSPPDGVGMNTPIQSTEHYSEGRRARQSCLNALIT